MEHKVSIAGSSLYVYDIDTRVWTDLSYPSSGTPPAPRAFFGFRAVGGLLYVHAGHGSGEEAECG